MFIYVYDLKYITSVSPSLSTSYQTPYNLPFPSVTTAWSQHLDDLLSRSCRLHPSCVTKEPHPTCSVLTLT